MDANNDTTPTNPYHHGNLRDALVAAALEILERENGNLTIRAAAKAVGVSHTAPYNHFADKDALMVAIATRGFNMLEASVGAAREDAGAYAGDQLVATGLAYVFFAAEHPDLFRLMFGPRKADVATDEVGVAGLSGFEALFRVMRDGMEAGAFRRGDPRSAAFTAWSLVHGMAQLAIDRTGPLTPEDRAVIAARLHASHAIMMDGLKPR